MDAFLEGGADYLGAILNVAFYGLHAGIYFLFLGIHRYRGTTAFRGLASISSSLTFAFGTAIAVVNVWTVYFELTNQSDTKEIQTSRLNSAYSVFYALIDFIAQSLLIYRCWIIWNKRYSIVVLPATLAVAGLWCAFTDVIIPSVKDNATIKISELLNIATAAVSASMAVNSIVTITIISRIWILSRRFSKDGLDLGDGAYTIVIAMLLESGVIIFLAQLVWLVLYVTQSAGYNVIVGAVTQIYGFTPTIILIRVAIGASYDTEKDATGANISFAHSRRMDTQSTPTMGDIQPSSDQDMTLRVGESGPEKTQGSSSRNSTSQV